MIDLVLILLVTWVLPITVGLLVLGRFGKEEFTALPLGVRLAMGYCVGAVLLLVTTLALSHFAGAWVWPTAAVAAFAALRLSGRARRQGMQERHSIAQGLGLGVLVASLVIRFWAKLSKPAFHSDELQIFGAKARALFFAGGLGERFSELVQVSVNRPDYPILSSILQYHVLLQSDLHEYFLLRVPFLAVQLLILIACVEFARGLGKPWLGLVSGLIVISNTLVNTIEVSGVGADRAFWCMGDGLASLGFLVVMITLYLGRTDRISRGVWSASLIGGLGSMVTAKNEGIMLFACVALVLGAAWIFAWRRGGGQVSWWRLIFVLGVPAALVLGNFTLIETSGRGMNVVGSGGDLGTSQFTEALTILKGRGMFVLRYFFTRVIFGSPALGLLVLLPITWFALDAKVRRLRGLAELVAILSLAVSGYVFFFAINGTGVFTPESTNTWQMDHAFLRVFFQILPGSLVVLIAMVAALPTESEAKAP